MIFMGFHIAKICRLWFLGVCKPQLGMFFLQTAGKSSQEVYLQTCWTEVFWNLSSVASYRFSLKAESHCLLPHEEILFQRFAHSILSWILTRKINLKNLIVNLMVAIRRQFRSNYHLLKLISLFSWSIEDSEVHWNQHSRQISKVDR